MVVPTTNHDHMATVGLLEILHAWCILQLEGVHSHVLPHSIRAIGCAYEEHLLCISSLCPCSKKGHSDGALQEGAHQWEVLCPCLPTQSLTDIQWMELLPSFQRVVGALIVPICSTEARQQLIRI